MLAHVRARLGMKLDDYYAELQIRPGAEPEVVEGAYKKLIFKHHPDRGGSAERATRIITAYAVLGDPVQRAEYDRQLGVTKSVPSPAARPTTPAGGSGRSVDQSGFTGPPDMRAAAAPAAVNPQPAERDGTPSPRVASPQMHRGLASRVIVFLVIGYFVLLAFAVVGYVVTELLPALLRVLSG